MSDAADEGDVEVAHDGAVAMTAVRLGGEGQVLRWDALIAERLNAIALGGEDDGEAAGDLEDAVEGGVGVDGPEGAVWVRQERFVVTRPPAGIVDLDEAGGRVRRVARGRRKRVDAQGVGGAGEVSARGDG